MAVHSFDAGLSYLAGNTTTPVAEVISIEPPTKKVNAVKTTHLKSSNAYHTYMPGFKEGGEIKAELSYTVAQCSALDALFEARTTTLWTITLPDTSTWAGQGFIQDFQDGKVPEDDRLTGTVTIKITGRPTWTAAT